MTSVVALPINRANPIDTKESLWRGRAPSHKKSFQCLAVATFACRRRPSSLHRQRQLGLDTADQCLAVATFVCHRRRRPSSLHRQRQHGLDTLDITSTNSSITRGSRLPSSAQNTTRGCIRHRQIPPAGPLPSSRCCVAIRVLYSSTPPHGMTPSTTHTAARPKTLRMGIWVRCSPSSDSMPLTPAHVGCPAASSNSCLLASRRGN